MTRATSLFLDGLRLLAASVVFAAHTSSYWNPALQGIMLGWAHHAVIVFFVLSGYVISSTTRAGTRDVKHYTVARLSRLYSVVAPALILTAVLRIIGRELDPGIYAYYERAYPTLRFLASSVFMNDIWFLEISPPTNSPFWSLSYEFWYYVFFGMAVFVRSPRLKWILLIAGALIAGPKIILLLPVWLVGVAADRWRDAGTFSGRAEWTGLIASIFAVVSALWFVPEWPARLGAYPWYFSGAAITDLIHALGWGAVIWFFNRCWDGAEINLSETVVRRVRALAAMTFPLYLFHGPLVVLSTALFPPLTVGTWATAGLLTAILLLTAVIGAFAEFSRAYWRRGLEGIWNWAVGRS